ncbi:MAG: hypothetical protein JW762_16240 [Dehalococcoidales bacterium]|nr:hypothetical protein [Dehalococcoidales bacterium]
MKYSNNQMAIVVDEYGGTDGIISLTDLIEEIVGETGDEYTAFEKSFEILDGDIFLIDGNMRIGDINDEMGLELPESEDYDTIAGFCLSILKHIPVLNEKLEFKNLLIKITEMQGLRITQVQVTREKPLSSEN